MSVGVVAGSGGGRVEVAGALELEVVATPLVVPLELLVAVCTVLEGTGTVAVAVGLGPEAMPVAIADNAAAASVLETAASTRTIDARVASSERE